MSDSRRPRSRIVVQTPSRQHSRPSLSRRPAQRNPEVWVAISVIVAAALATFLALFLTSRPYDPMNASVEPQQVVPVGPGSTPSPRPSPNLTPSPANTPSPAPAVGEPSPVTMDDATIQSNIEKALASDPSLSGLDISTLVENGRVTVVGSVRSPDLKQRVERMIRAIRGVSGVDNQLVISEATP